jgi:hypothetical protein
MKTSVVAAIVGLIASSISPALAAEVKSSPKAVVELFTSQGCSDCPPADALLKTIEDRPSIIALAYHVDYWDHLGWKDTFSSPAATERQDGYAAALPSSGGVYTPEIVVNGRQGMVGSDKNAVTGAIGGASLPVPVTIAPGGDAIDISIAGKAGESGAGIWLVSYIDQASVTVQRGELAGHKLPYTEIVTGSRQIGTWDPASGAHLHLSLGKVFSGASDGAVILVQRESGGAPGPILGAASIVR